MKNIFFCLFLFSSFLVSAQSFQGGLRAGAIGSQVNGDRLTGYNKGGLVFGGFVNRQLSEHFNAQMEIVYIQKGSRKPTDEFNSFYLLRVNYLEVPVLLQWYLTKKLGIEAGPAFATLVGTHEETEQQVFDSGNSFKKLEVSGNAGIIYKISDHWLFDGRYSASLIPIRDFAGVTTAFYDRGQYNIVLEFSLLYSF